MLRYQCPRCHEITHRDAPTAFCGICCGPLSAANVLPEPRTQARSLADLLNARDAARDAYTLPT